MWINIILRRILLNHTSKTVAQAAYMEQDADGNISFTDVSGSRTLASIVAAAGSFSDDFVNANLVDGVLNVAHNLGRRYVNASIYNESHDLVSVGNVHATSTTECAIDLTGVIDALGSLPGTWHVHIS